MDISGSVLSVYLNLVTAPIEKMEGLPEEFSAYDESILEASNIMDGYYESDVFRLAFAYLLNHPEIDLAAFISAYYMNYTDDRMYLRKVLQYAYEKIWGREFPPQEEIEKVRFTDMSYLEWTRLGKLRRQKKISRGAVAFYLTTLATTLGKEARMFDFYIEQHIRFLKESNEWTSMRYGFAYLLLHPQLQLREFVAPAFYTTEEELRKAMGAMYEKTWGTLPSLDEMNEVELVEKPLPLWRLEWFGLREK